LPKLYELTDPVERAAKVRSMIRSVKHGGIRARMQVCVWPTPTGPCLTTPDELALDGRSPLVAMQEHLRDEHLGERYMGDDNYDAFTAQLKGSGIHQGDDEHPYMQGAYVYSLANGQAWMFAGTQEQFDEWYHEHDDELQREGNRNLPTTYTPPRRSHIEPTIPIVLIDEQEASDLLPLEL
jgi:hypothetical protein